MLRIATNIMGINTNRNLKNISARNQKASEKLSSGLKINRAADDAAGLAISEKMKAQIRGLNQAQRNVEDGISLIQTAEGGMNEISAMVVRQRELIIQALNDTNTDEDRDKIQAEINQLNAEIDDMAGKTQFNGIPLLNAPAEGSKMFIIPSDVSGSALLGNFAVPAGEDFWIEISYTDSKYNDGGIPSAFSYFAVGGNLYGNVTGLNQRLSDTAFGDDTHLTSASISSGLNMVERIEVHGTKATEVWDILVSYSDTNSFTVKSSHPINFTTALDSKEISNNLYIQSGANANQGMNIDRYDCRTATLGINSIVTKPREAAEASLGQLDGSIEILNGYRANCGAQQNRLEHTDKFLGVAFANLEEANSRIADTDMAKEMMELTKANILSQAGISMMAQARQQPEVVLQLLK